MGSAQAERDAIVARYAADHAQAQRDMYRDLIVTFLKLVVCVGIGMFLIGMSVHVTDYQTGMIYFTGGCFFWVTSVSLTVLNAYKRGVLRGDWY